MGFLCLEHDTAPMHFGALLVFGPAPATRAAVWWDETDVKTIMHAPPSELVAKFGEDARRAMEAPFAFAHRRIDR